MISSFILATEISTISFSLYICLGIIILLLIIIICILDRIPRRGDSKIYGSFLIELEDVSKISAMTGSDSRAATIFDALPYKVGKELFGEDACIGYEFFKFMENVLRIYAGIHLENAYDTLMCFGVNEHLGYKGYSLKREIIEYSKEKKHIKIYAWKIKERLLSMQGYNGSNFEFDRYLIASSDQELTPGEYTSLIPSSELALFCDEKGEIDLRNKSYAFLNFIGRVLLTSGISMTECFDARVPTEELFDKSSGSLTLKEDCFSISNKILIIRIDALVFS